jgi:hypothetical protein
MTPCSRHCLRPLLHHRHIRPTSCERRSQGKHGAHVDQDAADHSSTHPSTHTTALPACTPSLVRPMPAVVSRVASPATPTSAAALPARVRPWRQQLRQLRWQWLSSIPRNGAAHRKAWRSTHPAWATPRPNLSCIIPIPLLHGLPSTHHSNSYSS